MSRFYCNISYKMHVSITPPASPADHVLQPFNSSEWPCRRPANHRSVGHKPQTALITRQCLLEPIQPSRATGNPVGIPFCGIITNIALRGNCCNKVLNKSIHTTESTKIVVKMTHLVHPDVREINAGCTHL